MRKYLIFSSLIIAGLLAILLREELGTGYWTYPYLTQIANTLLVSGTLSVLFKMFVDKEQQKIIIKTLKLNESVNDFGLQKIIQGERGTKQEIYIELIEKEKELYIVLNDGLRWIGNYSIQFQERFTKNRVTEVFLLDENSIFIKVLAEKTNTLEKEFKSKRQQSRNLLINLYQQNGQKGTLKIYALKYFPTHSMFCSKQRVFIVPYPIASRLVMPPLFEFEKRSKKGFLKFCLEDVEALRKESKLVFDSQQIN